MSQFASAGYIPCYVPMLCYNKVNFLVSIYLNDFLILIALCFLQVKPHLWKGILLASSRRNMSVSLIWLLLCVSSLIWGTLNFNNLNICPPLQPLLVWKFTLWILALTVAKSASIAGTLLGKKSSVASGMATSKWQIHISFIQFVYLCSCEAQCLCILCISDFSRLQYTF